MRTETDSADQFTVDVEAMNKLFRKTYWGTVFSKTASLSARIIALQSLWYIRKRK